MILGMCIHLSQDSLTRVFSLRDEGQRTFFELLPSVPCFLFLAIQLEDLPKSSESFMFLWSFILPELHGPSSWWRGTVILLALPRHCATATTTSPRRWGDRPHLVFDGVDEDIGYGCEAEACAFATA